MDTPETQAKIAELEQLLWQMRDGVIDAAGRARIEALVTGDAAVRRFYVRYSTLCGGLRWLNAQAQGSGVGGQRSEGRGQGSESGTREWGLGVQDPQPRAPSPEPAVPDAEPLVPPIIIDTSPAVHYPLFTIQSPLGGWLFSYAAATVITGMAILGAWAYKVSLEGPGAVANSREPTAPGDAIPGPVDPRPKEPESVGQIVDTLNCRWAGRTPDPAARDIAPGQQLSLASGLLEIAYHSGAKVILEGPCTYEVESAAGGFLSLGKLTARVERSEVRGQGSGHYPLATSHSPLFAVRTPTATIVDLGTEFGVEVSKEGTTTSHVFRGSVRISVVAPGAGPQEIVLRQDESARAERAGSGGGPRLARYKASGISASFKRRLVEPPRQLDLLDIVAGGDGTGHRRERGIDPTTGKEDPVFATYGRTTSRQYSPVAWWHKPIDGVFIPDGGAGPVVLDSARHTFAGFPKTSGDVFGSIWARAAEVPPQYREYYGAADRQHWIYTIRRPQQFMPQGRGLLAFCANVGMTFDLEALRMMHRETRPARFRAIAGLADARPFDPDADGCADIWVFVDGRLKLQRMHLRPQDGAVNVDVELGPGDRFLTLVSTDGGNGISYDWVVFGDPVLKMAPVEAEKGGTPMNGP